MTIETPAGPIQFGVPPETIKDSMALGLPIPTTFVVPPKLFDRRRGINLAEAEFPAYYNYFALKRRTRLVVDDEEIEGRLRAVFQESLFGPREIVGDGEFDPSFPRERRPDFVREMDYFRRQADGRRHTIDQLLEFIRFDGAAEVDLGEGVTVRRQADGGYEVFAGGTSLGAAPAEVQLPDRVPPPSVAARVFEPPAFGITVLGASHGFDPNGKTTGFVLWVGQRGILIDPPCDTTEHLRDQGVSAKTLDGVILTHCHADHDAGVLSKLLEEGRVQLFTTPTILGSFLRKYSALSGIDPEILRRTFKYRPVKIGAPTSINGADVYFFYTLHSIPALGFEIFYGGKSLAFSGDTLFDPERIRAMCDEGVMTPERRDALLGFPWHHSVVLHEAGVPPIHTPVHCLAALPADVKERLRLVHIAKKDVPAGQGLESAAVGLDETLRIEVRAPEHTAAVEVLDVFSSVELFRDLPLSRAREFLLLARRVELPAGARIISQDEPGDSFYVIASGVVSVVKDGERIKTYHPGDYFGETALVTDQARTADVDARTAVVLWTLDRHAFSYLLRGTDIPARLVRLARAREDRSWQLVEQNSALRLLTSSQKTELQTYLEARRVSEGTVLWQAGELAETAFLVDEGTALLEGDHLALSPFGPGALLCEVDALRDHTTLATTARMSSDGKVFQIGRADLLRFFENNPGVLLTFLGANFIE